MKKNPDKTVTILHVDDDPDFLELFKITFGKWFDIHSVSKSTEALQRLNQNNCSVVITDYEMPRLNGLELLKRIKETLPEIPVIFCTGQGNEKIAREAFLLGAADYFTKDVYGFAFKEKIVNAVKRALKVKKAEEEKLKSISQYKTLAENMPGIVFRLRLDDRRMIFLNDVVQSITGYSPEEMSENNFKSIHSLITPNDREPVSEQIKKVVQNGESYEIEYRINRKDHKVRHLIERGRPIYDKSGSALYIDGIILDITQRKLAKRKLSQSEIRFRTLAEKAPIGIFYSDLTGKLLYGNRKSEEIIGYKRADLIGRNYLKSGIIAPRSLPKTMKLLSLNLLGKSTGPDEITLVRKDKEQRIVEVYTTVLDIDNNKVVLGMLHDITVSKRIKEQLTDFEKQLQYTINNTKDIIFNIDLLGRFKYANKSAKEITGYNNEELTGKSILGLIAPEYKSHILNRLKDRMQGKELPQPFITELIHKNGGRVVLELNTNGTYDRNGNLKGIMGIARDITKRRRIERALQNTMSGMEDKIRERTAQLKETNEKLSTELENRRKAEKALKESEERFRQMVSFLPQIVYEIDLDGRFTYINELGLQISGYTREEFEHGINVLQAVHPDYHEKLKKAIPEILKGKETSRHEYTLVSKNGDQIPVKISSAPVVTDGEITGIRGIVVDISERKKIELILNKTGEILKQLIQRLAIPVFAVDADRTVQSWNSACEKTLGYHKEEAQGKNPGPLLCSEEDACGLEKQIGRVLEKGEFIEDVTIYFIKGDENKLQAKCGLYPVFNTDGVVEHCIVSIKTPTKIESPTPGLIPAGQEDAVPTEETAEGSKLQTGGHSPTDEEKKALLEKLNASEQRLKDIMKNSRDIILRIDLQGNYRYANYQTSVTTGYAMEELTTFNINKILTPGSFQTCVDRIKTRLSGGKPEQPFEVEVVTKDGGIIILELITTGIYEDGKLVEIQGVARDITGRKAAEEALAESREKLRSIFNSSPDAITVTDLNGIILDCNHESARMKGFSERKELIGENLFDYIDPDQLERAKKDLKTLLEKEIIRDAEYRLKDRHGNIYPALISVSVIKNKNGEPDMIITMTRNITREKEMENKLRNTIRELNDFTYRVSHDLKNPVLNSRGFISILKKDPSMKDILLPKIDNQLEGILTSIKRLLKLSRAGRVIEDKKKVNPAQLFKEVFHQVRWSDVNANIEFESEKVRVFADPGGLRTVIENLVENSFKYRDPEREQLKIKVSCRTEDGFDVIRYTDNGIGIAQKYIQKVMEPGYTTSQEKGTGFGLAIVKKIIEVHGGSFELKSEGSGKGTTFVLRLPIEDNREEKGENSP